MEMIEMGQCPICGCKNNKFLGLPKLTDKVKKLLNKDYRLYKCTACAYYFTIPNIQLSENEWNQLYSDDYFGVMTKWWADKRRRERNYILNKLITFSKNKFEKFLEIGVGEGYILIEAMKRGWHPTGIDVYDNRIPEAKSEKTTFLVGDFLKTNIPKESYDCIYLDSVLEHVPDPQAYIRKLYKILKSNGLIYLSIPNEDALIFEFKNTIYKILGKKENSLSYQPFLHPYHINGFTKKSLFKIMESNGFKVLNYRNYAGWYEFLKFKFLSKSFIKAFLTLPIHLIAILIRRQFYQDIIAMK